VGVRIRATHHGALVFEYLHPTVTATELSDLISPQFDYMSETSISGRVRS
jgi:hypothetical protein